MPKFVYPTLTILRQLFFVSIGFFILFLFFQCSLSFTKEDVNIISINGQHKDGTSWTFKVDNFYRISNEQLEDHNPHDSYKAYLSALSNAKIGSKIEAIGTVNQEEERITAVVEANAKFKLNGETVDLEELEQQIAHLGQAMSLEPAKQTTIKDVLAANVKTPVRSKVSLPGFTYKQAFPQAQDQAEYTIKSYNESPLVKKRTQLSKDDPNYLPPVEERLPRNPAVVWGPDGVGVYGGDLRQCTSTFTHLRRQLGTESFTRFDPSGNVQPALAYKWDVSDDLREYTFYLRKGHKWSDGRPFTNRDILHVCNDIIGAQRWSEEPGWMQATDGSKEISLLDITDWDALYAYLASDQSLSKHLKEMATTLGFNVNELLSDKRQDKIIELFNVLSMQRNFYDKNKWPALNLEADLAALTTKGYSQLSTQELLLYRYYKLRNTFFKQFTDNTDSMDENHIKRMNCMLIRLALPEIMRPPIKDRVIIEPIADEAGDDTHIIRFTFPRPNPLFLEKTATFMFYRGLFDMPVHKSVRYHYKGVNSLDFFDILDWPAFISEFKKGKTASSGMSSLLFAAMNAEQKNIIDQFQQNPDEDFPQGSPQQDAVIGVLNQLLASPAAFNAQHAKSLNLDDLLKPIEKESITEYQAPDWNRFHEYCQAKHLLERAEKNGIQSLKPEEVITLNTTIFRLSFNENIVAANREHALNDIAFKQPTPHRTWVIRHRKLGDFDPILNPHPPVLQAWRVISDRIERNIISIRNPYYYRVDVVGNQLPYLDRIVIQRESEENVRLLKLKTGNVDFQTREITPAHWSVLKATEYSGKYRLHRWANDYSGELNFYTLQTNRNETIGPIIRDPKFRRALSLSLNRKEMIDVFWQGLGTPAQRAVPEGSPYYSADHLYKDVEFDVAKANKLLDELGLTNRASDGTRLFKNGEPLTLNVHSSHADLSKAIQMACNYWRNIGINAQLKEATGASINRLLAIGSLEIAANNFGDSYFGPILGGSYAPTHPAECGHWNSWVKWYFTKGRGGEEPPESFKYRKSVWDKLVFADSKEESLKYWKEIQTLTAEELPLIGITTSPGQVVYVKEGFKNVPKLSLSGWIAHQPGNCCPEVFYKEKWAQKASAEQQEVK